MYGGKIKNEGKDDQFNPEDFANSYQNAEATGKKQFVILWLQGSYSENRCTTLGLTRLQNAIKQIRNRKSRTIKG
jgi:hypothetical protein